MRLILRKNGDDTEPSRIVDQRAKSEDLKGFVGTTSVEDEVAMERWRRWSAEEEDSARVRASPEANPGSLPCR